MGKLRHDFAHYHFVNLLLIPTPEVENAAHRVSKNLHREGIIRPRMRS